VQIPPKIPLSNRAAHGMLLHTMKNRIGVVILVLVLVCVGLGIALVAIKKQAGDQLHEASITNNVLSARLVEANDQLDRQKQVNADLYADREKRLKEIDVLTNKYVASLTSLAQVSNSLAQTEAALKASQEETAKRDAKIADLESQNQALDKKAVDLTTAITNLTTQIEDTKRKLATSEGEKGFLEKELKRLMAEKSELEKQFNDLTVLRAQVSKLKEELSVARRLEWIRQGLFASTEQRGAQKLMQGTAPPAGKGPKPAYDLNVEVSSDGSVKVIPPLTNRPAATNTPPK
jgi:DNA repair exonuclease SbcCD ATPase subunit